MSRFAPKSRTVVFVGRWHFGDNLKYAWLAALEHAEAAGFECWYLPPDARQEALVRSLGANCLPSDANACALRRAQCGRPGRRWCSSGRRA